MAEQDRTRVPRGEARDRIVAAATELFGRQGYEATTTRQIVEAAQVTKGALYHWFSSKEELLTSIYRELLAEQTSRLKTIAAADTPADARLHLAVTDLFAHMDDHAEPLTVWARSMHLVAGEHAAAVRAERRRYQHLFQDLIEEGQKAGVFRADVAASVITNTFLSSVVQIHRWFRPDGPLTRRELGTQMVALFLDGVRVG
ncbi:transcriptional regulator, TetR family [Catenulispora acidiphila DSM 44928]|uniref:Transcriptional regulator, TetR family n=1 Tax=Catenulispora acidiphila (strain DSM 44928 / JCM 14897 / NBRC 102108 / NRRL B-24433 / ID139908) TaxID=479433 RepID=C7QK04_CATAD|nr:TetR/AcrR family transcriptional regulator [Catenulispora acidiphila]ACU73242.1 transcriptional regulator, TetR family [Catenulispora acidiphila DSM 44928]